MGWTIERRGRVAVVTMTTNPVNAQNRAFFADPRDAFDRFERDRSDCPVALTGTGRRFSAGLDLDEHFRLFAGDPAAVGSWFADYRATNMRLFTYPPRRRRRQRLRLRRRAHHRRGLRSPHRRHRRIRQALKRAMTRSTAARMLLRSAWLACSFPPGGVPYGTRPMPSTPR